MTSKQCLPSLDAKSNALTKHMKFSHSAVSAEVMSQTNEDFLRLCAISLIFQCTDLINIHKGEKDRGVIVAS